MADKALIASLIIALLVPTAIQIPIGSGACIQCFRDGSYVEYLIVGKLTSIMPTGNSSTYIAASKVRYGFEGVSGGMIKGYYTVEASNDTRGVFFPKPESTGRRIPFNISIHEAYNASRFTIYIDPGKLSGNGHIHYVNISNDKRRVSRIVVDAYYDKDTGILINYSMSGEVNDTVSGSRGVFSMKYKLLDTNIAELRSVTGEGGGPGQSTVVPGHHTSTTAAPSGPRIGDSGSSFLYWVGVVIGLFIIFLVAVAVWNRGKTG